MVQDCDVSVVLEAFLDHSLDEALTWLSTEVPEVTAVEVGAGGYAPHPTWIPTRCCPTRRLARCGSAHSPATGSSWTR